MWFIIAHFDLYSDAMTLFFTIMSNIFMHIIIVKIVIDNVKVHSITIDQQQEIDLKLYSLRLENTLQ